MDFWLWFWISWIKRIFLYIRDRYIRVQLCSIEGWCLKLEYSGCKKADNTLSLGCATKLLLMAHWLRTTPNLFSIGWSTVWSQQLAKSGPPDWGEGVTTRLYLLIGAATKVYTRDGQTSLVNMRIAKVWRWFCDLKKLLDSRGRCHTESISEWACKPEALWIFGLTCCFYALLSATKVMNYRNVCDPDGRTSYWAALTTFNRSEFQVTSDKCIVIYEF